MYPETIEATTTEFDDERVVSIRAFVMVFTNDSMNIAHHLFL